MLQTSQARLSETTRSGFTLVEVLIALLLAIILVSVTASTLSVTLRAEDSLHLQESGERLIQTLQTDLYLSGSASNSIARFSDDWLFVATRIEMGGVTNRRVWDTWEITAKTLPSVQWRLALNAGAAK
ncbi:MAG: prepilin-type N-terminal cleavage/methylation domain-containing protein [Verrucomicrobia bacterium]|nr:prepilin-type N-terminal cleavage/methylation domain-containing protein [Kiritimatiellia bacterium]MCO6400980.1 prepilin-type N-terminal cleavage/methylation domain-containing protein [Verrucomicrobiota bacterium]